jgi:hypothetical protein
MKAKKHDWPDLPYADWHETMDTLHLWMQVVGKVKLALSPFINQWWEVVFYVTSRGMTTGRIPYAKDTKAFQVDFDFLDHMLTIQTSSGEERKIPLKARTVAAFYREFMQTLKSLEIVVTIWPVPVEFSETIPFPKDTKHHSYDPVAVTKWWRSQVLISLALDRFRSSFRGKSSPIQFYWGSFDLNGTRFSGKLTKPPQKKGVMGRIMNYAENEENFAFGFWPGDRNFPHAAFYTYLYPQPIGIETLDFGKHASFNEQLGECILPYDAVRKSPDPEQAILQFLETTYSKSATLAGWDIKSLTAQIPPDHVT